MIFKPYYKMFRIRKNLGPDREFKNTLRIQLEKRWNGSPGEKQAATHLVWRYSVAGAMSLVLFVGIGTGAYAYASPEVTYGTALYPIKKGLEHVEGTTKTTPEAKAKFQLKQLERREAEEKVLESHGKDVTATEKQILILEDQLGQLEKMLQKVEVKDANVRPQVKQRLEKRLKNREVLIEKQIERATEHKSKIENMQHKEDHKVDSTLED